MSIEPVPRVGNRIAASWVNPLLVKGRRLFVFYTFNLRNTTHWADRYPNGTGKTIKNSNLLGGQFFRWSDDQGECCL